MLLSTVHRGEHMRRGVGSARCLLRLRYLPSLQLAVDSRFSLRCWPSATKNCTPPSLWSPSDTHHQPRPRSYAARLCFRCRHSARRLSRRHPPPRLKKNPYYRTIARARSRPRGNVRWELDFCIDFAHDGTSPRPRIETSPWSEFSLTQSPSHPVTHPSSR